MPSSRPPERRQLTVMLCDVAGWTALSLRLDPEELAELIQTYRQLCTDLVTAHGGMVAQYVGDAVLAYFGYPRAHEDDAERAIRAALGIVAGPTQAPVPMADWAVHVGIATGVVVVGDLSGGRAPAPGAETDFQGREGISAVGSALNLAARLQTLAAPGTIVVCEQTRRLSGGIFEYRDLGKQDFKGADAPVQAWQVLRESALCSRFQARRASGFTPLVGRQRELQELRTLWETAQAGQGVAVLLSAEPGVGKSRLAEELSRHVVGRRCLRLWYHCLPHLQSTPLAPLVSQLTLAARFTDRDDADTRLGKVAALLPAQGAANADESVPLLASLLSVPYEHRYPALNMSPQRQKQRLFQALMQLLEAHAARTPVLLVVEDLHWVDPSSDELIGLLIDHLHALPILAVFTARPEFQSHWDDRPQLLHMPLHPLERADSIAMIEQLCGERAMPAATVARIADETDGLPLFIEDLTRDVLELAELKASDQGPQQASPSFQIPTTLTGSLMARLDRLGSAKSVAQVGATIGREFSYELLAKVAGLPEEQLRDELYRLLDSGLLVARRSAALQTYAFKHALVRDAAYASMLKKAQAALHARIARVLLEKFPDTAESQPEVLAHHFQAAKDIGNALHFLVQAAKRSARRSGFVEAISQLERALSLLGTEEPSRERTLQALRVHLALGGINAEYRGFSSAACGRAYGDALALCHALGDAPQIFSVLSGLGAFEITRAHFGQCRTLAEECLARATRQSSRAPFVMGHLLLGGTLFLTGELAAAREHLEEAIRIYEQSARSPKGGQVLYVQDQKSTGLCYLALTLTLLGELERGLQAARDGLAHSESLGGLHTINYSLCYLAAVLHIQGDTEEALVRATQSLELAREQGFATWIGISQMIRGACLARRGDTAGGLADITSGIAAHRAMEAVTYQPYGLSILAQALIATGRQADALAALDEAVTLSETTGDRFYFAELLRLRGEAFSGQGRVPQAEACLREAIEVSQHQGAKLFELRSAASLARLTQQPQQLPSVRAGR